MYDNAGRPGVQAFRFAVRRAGLQISDAEAKAFVAAQSQGQIFQGRIPSDGKVVGGSREDMRWQIDLIDWSKRIRKLSGKHRYALVAVDNYNRPFFTQPMQNQTAELWKRFGVSFGLTATSCPRRSQLIWVTSGHYSHRKLRAKEVF